MSIPIDWQALAKELGTIQETGESGSDFDARRALELIIGADELCKAVDWVIHRRPGFALTRGILRVLQSWAAIQHCYNLYRSQDDVQVRRAAVWLLSDIADPQTLAWVEEFLDDADAEIQAWGIHLLNELVRSSVTELDGSEELLSKAEQHANPHVRERADEIRRYLKNRVIAGLQ
jgi:HEAT repeat protein